MTVILWSISISWHSNGQEENDFGWDEIFEKLDNQEAYSALAEEAFVI